MILGVECRYLSLYLLYILQCHLFAEKNLPAKLNVNIVDKKFQHFNDIYLKIFCLNIRVVLNEVCVQICKNKVFKPTSSVFMTETVVYDFFLFYIL